ncbi:hypothetical protein AVEN_268135-1 [Araneus ventricosus]|uniref:Uncharacterized protein n=1 Tax=Araneus ventricosus TaxID=182803 RepID=A0A4Y2K907_ARAVE|nr:hypothetical protein AVEN_268135-1 [Araneus ventricosus]
MKGFAVSVLHKLKIMGTIYLIVSTTEDCMEYLEYGIPKIAILVCSKLALQICKLAGRLTRQECKLEISLQKRRSHHATNLQQACHVKPRPCSKSKGQTHCKQSTKKISDYNSRPSAC